MTLYVRKIRVAARVSQPNLTPRDGWFLLLPHLEAGDRHETLLDLLNSSRTVIPFILAEGGEVLLLTRANLDWVVVQKGVDSQLVYPPGRRVTSEQRVDLRLIDESRVHAVVQWNSPNGETRLSDFLNREETFIAAKTDFGTLLINKLRVRETRVAESTARAVAPVDPGAPIDPLGTDNDRDRFTA
jgi:hypothetical protein